MSRVGDLRGAVGQGDLRTRRLEVAAARGFAPPGVGPARRAAVTELTRDWLAGVWERALAGAPADGVALAAVGSLARGEGGPLSDVDLVLLHTGRALADAEVGALADRVWYPVWDAGVRLDHSVRTVNQCRVVATEDLTAAVGLLDIDCVAGDAEVVAAARSTLAHDWRANARTRLPQLLDALRARHDRHGDLAQALEPDLKEAHGGLRDMTVLRALAAAWLADRPHGRVDEAYAALLDVRDAVHLVTGRARNRLTREDHDAVAALLGRAEADDLLTEVSTAASTLAYALDATLRRAAQSQRARSLRVGPRRPALRPLGFGLFEHDGEVVLGPRADPAGEPLLTLRAAVAAARGALPIAPATLQNLATRAPVLPEPWPAAARDLFADLLAAGPGLVTVWEGLAQSGIVQRWLPEWSAVRCRPQRSPVHRHTVDRHLLATVVVASGLVRGVARPDLLLLGALLHDIGKVRGARDHSARGEPIARAVALRLGLQAADVDTVALLVREHLALVELATRRDHHDPATLAAARAAAGGSAETFELLLALTEADARAAGPLVWTDWRAALVRQLAETARATWPPGEAATAPASRLAVADPGAVAAGEPRVPADRDAVAERAPVADGEPRDMAEMDVLVDLAALGDGEPRVVVRPRGGSWRVDVVDRDRVGLFADTAGLLAAHGLVVRTAVLRTRHGVAVDQWHVESPGGDAPDGARIGRGLARLAAGDRTPLERLQRRRPPDGAAADSATAGVRTPLERLQRRRPPDGAAADSATAGDPGGTRALVVPHASADATVLEVRTQDRPGLLHELGAAFAAAGLSVRSAHIATYAGQTLDTFYLTGLDGGRLSPAEVAQTVARVIDTCDGPT